MPLRSYFPPSHGWNLTALNIITGSLVVLYTVSGGTRAVAVTQKQQMFVIFLGMAAAFTVALKSLPGTFILPMHSALRAWMAR